METGCPERCAAGTQRPLDSVELSQLFSNSARAEIALLRQTVYFCATCQCVYAHSTNGTVRLGKVRAAGHWAAGRWESKNFDRVYLTQFNMVIERAHLASIYDKKSE